MYTPDGMPPNPDAALLGTLLERNGTWALLRVFAALALFLALHLIRIPLVVAARILAGVMARLDAYATRRVSTPPRGPINQFFDPHNTHPSPGPPPGRMHWEVAHA
ncbi:hypothetical protein SAMN04489727_2134 [Amycolatopsis tolypomycina]|uniref:Uncharacterized protein n=1 Tax=Amycolatopsis tolypomycina TaxID=208445 RepID=A0A1H4JRG3_9PSEU|nr:hypothetical protein [Amycolatopsis tolypomycina]SEB48833.1 hypothetical protein SAMN04489727_2134 [Amycolatopsis tolypomycina]